MKILKIFSWCLTAVVLSIPMIASTQNPTIYCGVYKSDSWGSTLQRGIYTFPAQSNTTFTKISSTENDSYLAPLGGAAVYDGVFHGVHYTSGEIYGETYYTFSYVEYDTKTWTQIKKKSVNYNNIAARCNVSIDPTTGLVWGLFNNFDLDYNIIDRKWATVDYATQSKTIIDAMDLNMVALAIDNSGLTYAIATDGKLYMIDKGTTAYVPVGATGLSINSGYPMCAAIDPETNKMYWSAVLSDGTTGLYEVNKGTGSTTLVSKYPNNEIVVNMWIPAPEAANDAPASPQNLELDFQPNALTGTVRFQAPTSTYSNHPLTGELTYSIVANGATLASGEPTTPGATVSRQVTVQEAGMTEFEVVVTNTAGNSPQETIKQWIGPDTPTAPIHVEFNYDDAIQQATLTWAAPTVGQHEAQLDPAALTYNVVRQPSHVIVAEGIAETTFTERLNNITDLKSYYYQVIPMNGTLVGDKGESNHIVLGEALDIPYSETFYNKDNFDLFTVIDANGDGTTWQHKKTNYQYSTNEEYASIIANEDTADDDWLITPPLKMEKGQSYDLSFKAKKQYSPSDYDQMLQIYFGEGTDVSTYSKLGLPYLINAVSFTEIKKTVFATTNGNYHFAFHAFSPAGSDELGIDDIKVVKGTRLQGDIDGDEQVNVTDVTALINHVLGAATYNTDLCDINGDDDINVSDVTTLINLLLGV